MSHGSPILKPLLSAVVVFIITTSAFVYLWSLESAVWMHSEQTLFFIGFSAIALLTTLVYQSIRTGAAARSLATSMFEDKEMYSHELFSELYRNSPVPYVLIDEQHIALSLNAAALRLFAVKEKQFEGTDIFERIVDVPEVENGKRDLLPQYFKQGVSVSDAELCIMRTDGELRWVRLSLFSFTDAMRARRGLLTFVDITKLKEIDKAKTEFVSLASHQLRTPISAMKWNLELLRQVRGPVIPELELAYIDKIDHGVTRMELLISDFLSVSRLELGTLTPTYDDVALGEFFGLVLEEYEKLAAVRNITIERDWEHEATRTLHTDVHLFNMAIGNLVSNALKYTPEGGRVRISVKNEGKNIIVTVADTGIGIPVDEQEHIFTKIFRASNAKAQKQEGTGLGLYIVREILKVLGGTVTFTSTVNVGTTFTVVLPVP